MKRGMKISQNVVHTIAYNNIPLLVSYGCYNRSTQISSLKQYRFTVL